MVDQKGLRDRIANDRAGLGWHSKTSSLKPRQVGRPTDTILFMDCRDARLFVKTTFRFELEAVLAQWRNEREKYIDTKKRPTL